MSWRDYKVDTLLTTLSIFNNELVRERGTVTVCSTVQALQHIFTTVVGAGGEGPLTHVRGAVTSDE
jgi:hypothetical protein